MSFLDFGLGLSIFFAVVAPLKRSRIACQKPNIVRGWVRTRKKPSTKKEKGPPGVSNDKEVYLSDPRDPSPVVKLKGGAGLCPVHELEALNLDSSDDSESSGDEVLDTDEEAELEEEAARYEEERYHLDEHRQNSKEPRRQQLQASVSQVVPSAPPPYERRPKSYSFLPEKTDSQSHWFAPTPMQEALGWLVDFTMAEGTPIEGQLIALEEVGVIVATQGGLMLTVTAFGFLYLAVGIQPTLLTQPSLGPTAPEGIKEDMASFAEIWSSQHFGKNIPSELKGRLIHGHIIVRGFGEVQQQLWLLVAQLVGLVLEFQLHLYKRGDKPECTGLQDHIWELQDLMDCAVQFMGTDRGQVLHSQGHYCVISQVHQDISLGSHGGNSALVGLLHRVGLPCVTLGPIHLAGSQSLPPHARMPPDSGLQLWTHHHACHRSLRLLLRISMQVLHQ
ncbi:hypothetical protein NN561_012147 [Cricetulus griseus]